MFKFSPMLQFLPLVIEFNLNTNSLKISANKEQLAYAFEILNLNNRYSKPIDYVKNKNQISGQIYHMKDVDNLLAYIQKLTDYKKPMVVKLNGVPTDLNALETAALGLKDEIKQRIMKEAIADRDFFSKKVHTMKLLEEKVLKDISDKPTSSSKLLVLAFDKIQQNFEKDADNVNPALKESVTGMVQYFNRISL